MSEVCCYTDERFYLKVQILMSFTIIAEVIIAEVIKERQERMNGLFESLAGTVSFRAYSPEGTDRTAEFAGRLMRSARFFSLSSSDGAVRGTVLRIYFPRVMRIAEKLGMTVSDVRERGIYFFLKRYIRRTGFVIGAVFAFILTVFFSNIVMRIEISGNKKVSDDDIISMLRGCGIYYGSFIPAVDLRDAENILLTSSEDFSWAAIRHSGCRVIVEVNEITRRPDTERKNYPCNIIAARDAQITGIEVYSGMLIPMMGDTVRKGEILISGVVAKKFRGTFYVHAMGTVTGRYRETVSFTQPFDDTEEICGEPYKITQLELFGRRFGAPKDTVSPGEFESAENAEYIKFLGLTLPAAVIRTEIYPIESRSVKYSKEQADEILDKKLQRYENNFLNDGKTAVTDRKIYRSYTESGASVRAEYIIEGDIGKESLIFVGNRENADAGSVQ